MSDCQPDNAKDKLTLTQNWVRLYSDPPVTQACEQGDNDPVDVVEIGSEQLKTGGVYKVKVLGAYAMIDEGELDWKIIAIRADDPMADYLNDIDDIERYMPSSTLMHVKFIFVYADGNDKLLSSKLQWLVRYLHGSKSLVEALCPSNSCTKPTFSCRRMEGTLEKIMIWFRSALPNKFYVRMAWDVSSCKS